MLSAIPALLNRDSQRDGVADGLRAGPAAGGHGGYEGVRGRATRRRGDAHTTAASADCRDRAG